ncbi:MAG TPA: TatD family hydrolase [Mycobacteriales bacterium]|nr:TatD family hydrolase [Mycobacteriales bacterium]
MTTSASGRERYDAGRRGDAPPPPEPLSVAAVDAHCHLDLMDVTVEEAVAAAKAVGIDRLVTIGIDVPSSEWSMQTATDHADVYATVAIHPNEAHTADERAWSRIAELADDPSVVGVGETGLDHYRTAEDGWRQQEESFRRHIDIAKRSGKALVIHDRDAHGEVLRVLEKEGAPDNVVFHCFSGDADFARACADRGYVMSFAGNVTFKNADDLRAAAAIAPADLLLVETDAPFLTPMPYRGRPNAPYLVPMTVRALAAVRGESPEEVAAAVSATAARVFAWGRGNSDIRTR